MSEQSSAISIVMAVCARDEAEQIETAIKSVINQSLPPEQIVVVSDGPVGDSIEKVLGGFERSHPEMITVVRYETNMGPAYAWNRGIEASRNDLIARMDSDDISRPERLEIQLRYMNTHPDVDLLGGFISEFSDGDVPGTTDRVRRVPLEHQEIVSVMKKRNAINHVTVMFRKSAVQSVRSYYQINNHVDYFLWVRMAMNGARFMNVEDVLVDVRASSEQMARRGGWRYVLSEVQFYSEVVKLGFMSPFRGILNFLIRFPFRMAPKSVRKRMYMMLRKT